MAQTTRQVIKKAPNPTGKGGFAEHPENINPGGEPKNSLKSYVARKLAGLTDEEKEAWLAEHKITGIDQWKMGEGNPSNELTGKDGGPIQVEDSPKIKELTNLLNEIHGSGSKSGDGKSASPVGVEIPTKE